MKRKLNTIRDCFDKYYQLMQIHSSVDYAEMASVRKSNRAMDEMIKVANGIISEFDNGLTEYAKLLDIDEMKYYAAFHLLNQHMFHQLELPMEIENKALEIIKHKTYSEDIFAYRLWLKDWEEMKKRKKAENTKPNVQRPASPHS